MNLSREVDDYVNVGFVTTILATIVFETWDTVYIAILLRSPNQLFGFLSDEGPMLETLDHTIRIGSTPTFLYFDLYLYSAYAAHYVHLLK